jgi:hypothetical protein
MLDAGKRSEKQREINTMRLLSMTLGMSLSAVMLLIACDGANFGGGGGGLSQKEKKEKKDSAADDDDTDSDTDKDDLGDIDLGDSDHVKEVTLDNNTDGNASAVYDDTESGVRKEVFNFGVEVKAPLVDFVFVIDNSVSMKQIVTNTASGFDSLASDKVWPERAQIAVMSTMVGDRANLKTTHPGISRYNGIDQEPGFLEFVDKKAIADYKAAVPKFAGEWPVTGCSEKWFKPADKNSAGDSCFKAHTQSSNHGVGCEPGITAVSQFLDKNKGQARFRKGALVNFVFVSDTHDPGCGNNDLKTQLPQLTAIRTKLETDNVITGLKFHALAPAAKCTGEELYGKSYYSLVDATKGYKEDPCNLKDYSAFIRQMVVEATKQEDGVFVLSKDPKKIIKVVVDGKTTDEYEYDENKGTIVLKDLSAGEDHKIEIIYQYK